MASVVGCGGCAATLGLVVGVVREARGMSAETLAGRAGVPLATLEALERGEAELPAEYVDGLSRQLLVPAALLTHRHAA